MKFLVYLRHPETQIVVNDLADPPRSPGGLPLDVLFQRSPPIQVRERAFFSHILVANRRRLDLVFGFFLLAAGPIGFQYGAEITFPIPEGTSNGLLLLVGQISGILFIFGMDALKSPADGSMAGPLVGLVALLVLCLGLGTRLEEPAALPPAGDAAGPRPAGEPS